MSNIIEETKFSFERSRGIVWVCDIENSSKFLNDRESVLAIEEYLPRLHWLGRIVINVAGGHFIKWTGDGFLGWFPIDLHRDLGVSAAKVLRAIWHLSLLNNVTRLGVKAEERLLLRHGLTVEHDALITTVEDKNGKNIDLIGRSVVLAFRIAGIRAKFPNIVAQGDIVKAATGEDIAHIQFRKLRINTNDRMRYFKGEKFETENLYESSERKYRKKSKEALLQMVRKQIAATEQPHPDSIRNEKTELALFDHLRSGPEWTREIYEKYMNFLQNDLLGVLKQAESVLQSSTAQKAKSEKEASRNMI